MIFYVKDISLDVCLDVFGSVGILERIVGVFIVGARWGNVRNHDCPAIATERIFEKPSQLGVAKGNVIRLPLGIVLMQHIDTVAES